MSAVFPLSPAPSPSPSVDPNMVPTQPRSRLVEAAGQVAAWLADRPWLAGLAVVAVVGAHAARAAVRQWRHRRLTRHPHQILITPPPEVDPAGAAAWWANLHALLMRSRWRSILHGVPHVAVEYRWAGRHLPVVVWVPGTVAAGPVAAAVGAAWPGAACTVQDVTAPIPAAT